MENLFNDRKFYDLASSLVNKIEARINSYTKEIFDAHSVGKLTGELVEEFRFHKPSVKKENIYQKKPTDIKIQRSVSGRGYNSQRISLDGTQYTFVIPIEGDISLLRIFPSSYMTYLPHGTFGSDAIEVIYKVPVGEDASRIKMDFDKNVDMIETYIGFLEKDIDDFNSKLEPSIKISLEKRKNKLSDDDDIAKSFGFPIK